VREGDRDDDDRCGRRHRVNGHGTVDGREHTDAATYSSSHFKLAAMALFKFDASAK
jgi:hypothetical protein